MSGAVLMVGREMEMEQKHDAQAAADKVARKICREAYAAGAKAPYDLRRLLELKLSLKVVRAIYRKA